MIIVSGWDVAEHVSLIGSHTVFGGHCTIVFVVFAELVEFVEFETTVRHFWVLLS